MKRKKCLAADELAWMKDPFFFNKRMNELVSKLMALPYADDIRVFGSAARGKDKPGDIDLFIDLRGKGKHGAWTELLALAREYYGPYLRRDGTCPFCQRADKFQAAYILHLYNSKPLAVKSRK